VGYATYPSVKLQKLSFDSEKGKNKLSFVKELLFGDFMQPYVKDGAYVTAEVNGVEYIKVRCRNADGYIKKTEMQAERPVEVNFIDVGQGDGCHIVTPDDKHFLIDAGKSDNMYRFLKWRFNLRTAKTSPPPFTVVISHSDTDHYQGFGKIFTQTKGTAQQFSFKKIYHNGMVEIGGGGLQALGKEVTVDGQKYITNLCDTDADFKKLRDNEKNGVYINTLKKTDAPKVAIRKGSDPIYDKDGVKIEVMGPAAVKIDGKDALPVFGSNAGKTKNGHSVVLKLTVGNLRLLVGGDLNTESEYHLIGQYSGIDVPGIVKQLGDKKLDEAKRKDLEAQVDLAVKKARESLEVDIAKSCHHGSADFTTDFLRVLNPIATIISSGDEEPYAHPRPDTLGTIGKHSRGERSLIFSTELARSGKEFLELDKSKMSAEKKKERVVTVYGMINVRADGEKAIIAQKLERPLSKSNWDIHQLKWNAKKGEFEYIQGK
jgi:beta-lactamase superfamily II metal-dependent hydrolase